LVSGDLLGQERLAVAGDRDNDRGGAVHEVERAGDNVTVRVHDDPRGGAEGLAKDRSLGAGHDHVGAALRLDLDHAGADGLGGLLDRLLEIVVEAAGLLASRGNGERASGREAQTEGAKTKPRHVGNPQISESDYLPLGKSSSVSLIVFS